MEKIDERLASKGREILEQAAKARLQAAEKRAKAILARVGGLEEKVSAVLAKQGAPDLRTFAQMMRLEHAGDVGRARFAEWYAEHGPQIQKALDAVDPSLRADFPGLVGASAEDWSSGRLIAGHTRHPETKGAANERRER